MALPAVPPSGGMPLLEAIAEALGLGHRQGLLPQTVGYPAA